MTFWDEPEEPTCRHGFFGTCADHGLTRDQQRTDRTYRCPDGSAFWTPDCEGRYWYDSTAEAIADGGPERVQVLERRPEDW